MATVMIRFVLVLHFCFISQVVCHRWERSHRPSFAGSTGGTWENYVGQIIPPGTPWPSKPGEYSTTSKTTSQIKVDGHLYPETTPGIEKETSTTVLPVKEADSNNSLLGTTTETNSSKQALNSSDSGTPIVLEYKPIRPSFAGSTGGTSESYVGQKVPSGTPQPEKDQKTPSEPKEDEVATDQPDTTTMYNTTKPSVIQVAVVLEYQPSRPSFAGSVGGSSFTVPTSTSTEKPSDRPGVSSLITTTSPVVLGNKPDRPSFAGLTGGIWESYVGQKVPGHVASTSTEKSSDSLGSSSSITTTSPVVLGNKPDRPSFAGLTGGTWESIVGQKVPGHENQTSKADETDTTTRSTITSTLVLEEEPGNSPDTDKDDPQADNSTTLITFPTDDEDTRPSFVLQNASNRPSFAGSGSGSWENLVGQVVPSNKNNVTTPTSGPKEVTSNVPKQVKPYVYIALDRDDIKNAISKNNVAKLSEIEVKLNTLKAESVNGEDAIQATDKFLTAERCNNQSSLKKTGDPVIHIFLNIEGLVEALKQSHTKIGDNLKSND